jgi:flagella basal body P-ring formation protein FlgA
MTPARYNLSWLVLSFCLAGGSLGLGAEIPLVASAPSGASNQISGSDTNSRSLTEIELLPLLTSALQTDHVKDAGELELRLVRPWQPITVPNTPLSVKIVDLPTSGVSAYFTIRFEIRTNQVLAGTYQALLQAKVWREIPVAQNTLTRGHALTETDYSIERRDMLGIRGEVATLKSDDPTYELKDYVPAGSPILARSIRPKPVVKRGQTADAYLCDGNLQIRVKVELLEDGAPGQLVRLRNITSRREIRGIVQDENKIVVPL